MVETLTNLRYPFKSNFYVKFRPDNADELIEKFMAIEADETSQSWTTHCKLKTTAMIFQDYLEEMSGLVKCFAVEMRYGMDITLQNPWLNHYERGYFQEIHDHINCDMSLVMFLNQGENFAEFYFYDEVSYKILPMCNNLRDILGTDVFHRPKINAGDVIVFPSTFLHGVTPHESDIVRKTFSFNFNVEAIND